MTDRPTPDQPTSPPGRLLSGSELRSLVNTPDKIFRDGTWTESNLDSTGYYARLAGSPLVLPERDAHGLTTSYISIAETAPPISDFTLQPGETAVISTVECFSMDLDVVAHIGPQFRLAARGVLMLHGTTAHPGYGRSLRYGKWAPDDNVRLYFVIANIGPSPLVFQCGEEKIVYLQFFNVEPEPELHQQISSAGFSFLKTRLYNEQVKDAGGLTFFRTVSELQTSVRTLGAEVERAKEVAQEDRKEDLKSFTAAQTQAAERATKDLGDLKVEIDNARLVADKATNASNYVVVFGVFLVATAILGMALTSMSTVLEGLPEPIDRRGIVVLVLAFLYGVATVTAVILVARAIQPKKDKAKK